MKTTWWWRGCLVWMLLWFCSAHWENEGMSIFQFHKVKTPSPLFAMIFEFVKAAEKNFWICRTLSFHSMHLILNAVLRLNKMREWTMLWYRPVGKFGRKYCSTACRSGNISVYFQNHVHELTSFFPVATGVWSVLGLLWAHFLILDIFKLLQVSRSSQWCSPIAFDLKKKKNIQSKSLCCFLCSIFPMKGFQ